jgi:hypothetical protein
VIENLVRGLEKAEEWVREKGKDSLKRWRRLVRVERVRY